MQNYSVYCAQSKVETLKELIDDWMNNRDKIGFLKVCTRKSERPKERGRTSPAPGHRTTRLTLACEIF